VAFSPDAATLASAGLDGTVRLWSGEEAKGSQCTLQLGAPIEGASWASACLAVCLDAEVTVLDYIDRR